MSKDWLDGSLRPCAPKRPGSSTDEAHTEDDKNPMSKVYMDQSRDLLDRTSAGGNSLPFVQAGVGYALLALTQMLREIADENK